MPGARSMPARIDAALASTPPHARGRKSSPTTPITRTSVKVARGQRKMRRRAAQQSSPACHAASQCCRTQRIQQPESPCSCFLQENYETQSHTIRYCSTSYKYLPQQSQLLALAAGIASRSVRIAYFSALAHAHLLSSGIAATAAFTTFAALSAFWCSTATI